ncbi:MAG: PAS domain-containing sensor histidine kinase [Candidatus Melainabacteria bacterium]|nr:PAS domain-containing sensor histidine kinase [Candidatus Melainabacteria bacterium]
MRLATKGMLLVAVPVLMQVSLIITMSVLLWQAHSLALEEASTKEVISSCNQLVHSTGDIVKRLYGIEGDASPLTTEDLVTVKQNIYALKERLGAEKEQLPSFKRLNELADQFIPLLNAVKDHKFESNGSKFRSERVLFTALDEVYDCVNSIITSVNTVHDTAPEQRARAAEAIKYALIAFVVVSVVLSLALAYFASISIGRPLELMAKNADRIGQGVPLEPSIGGRDELASLDDLLHQVEYSIGEALTSERNLIAYAGDLVCSVDEHGIFTSANPYASTLLGCSPERLISSSGLDFVVSDDCDMVDRLIGSRTESGTTTNLEVRMRTAANCVIDTSWSAIWSERDHSLFCVIHDISERKSLERLKQDFIAMISHDLRTPLMSVHSSLDLVQSGATGELAEQTQSQLGSASRSTEHLIELVNDLLDFEKLEAGRMDFSPESLSLAEVFEETCQHVKALSDKMDVQIQLPERTMSVRCDRRKLVQVLVNLVSNALKHSPSGGSIRLENKPMDGMVEISVHDQGPGVPEEYKQSIFAPFEQISSRATAALGTGLGLAICKLIVEGQGGKIGVRPSEFLKGSGFWLTVSADS